MCKQRPERGAWLGSFGDAGSLVSPSITPPPHSPLASDHSNGIHCRPKARPCASRCDESAHRLLRRSTIRYSSFGGFCFPFIVRPCSAGPGR